MFLPLSRRPGSFAFLVVLLLLLAGCSTQPSRVPDTAQTPVAREPPISGGLSGERSLGERAAVVAVRQVGVPYRYGGSSTNGFDCSGLVQYAYASAGKPLPRTTTALWHQTRSVAKRDLEVGDLLFFDIEGKVGHVGLYLGDRRFVHAPSSGREVTIADLDSEFYRRAFIRGGRVD